MAALEFPENPVLNQTYDFPPFQYIWDGVKWKTVGRGADTVAEAINAHKSAVDQHSIAGVAGLQAALDDLAEKSGDPVLSAKWVQKRSAMWTGYAPQDGQLLSRALYPDAFAGILAGMLPVCSDADWLANPGMRGCATLGDGSTTFRLPDLNGVQPGSYGPVYLGGGTTDGGTILRDRIQNITGSAGMSSVAGLAVDGSGLTGAFKLGAASNRPSPQALAGYNIDFDASRVARTGDTTRPITAEGCIAIKLFGAVQNTGSADAAALATAVAELSSRIDAWPQVTVTAGGCVVKHRDGRMEQHFGITSAANSNLNTGTLYSYLEPFVRVFTLHVSLNQEPWSANNGSSLVIESKSISGEQFKAKVLVHSASAIGNNTSAVDMSVSCFGMWK